MRTPRVGFVVLCLEVGGELRGPKPPRQRVLISVEERGYPLALGCWELHVRQFCYAATRAAVRGEPLPYLAD